MALQFGHRQIARRVKRSCGIGPMVKALRHVPSQTPPGKRYSLRTLFAISGAIALPFLLLANVQHKQQPEDSVASPLYLVLGVLLVLFAASIGGALGRRPGMIAAASIAALSWILIALLFSEFSRELSAVLPVHVICAVATVAVLVTLVRPGPESPDEGPHAALLRLLKVKSDVRSNRKSRGISPDVQEDGSLSDSAPPKSPA